jgi:DNA-binding MarR family transcriptional regulator
MDKLVKMGIVSRQKSATDRRVINILLTPYGRKMLEEFQKKVQRSVKMDLSCLTNEELQELSVSLRKLREILLKLP